MMGAGKSTVARLLAERLGWRSLDVDEVIEGRVGTTVAEMFAELGEAAFRTAEAEAVAELASSAFPVVVSVGGGAVVSEANRQALRRAGTVIWLRALPATLAERVGRGEGRPLLAASKAGPGGAEEVLGRLAEERRQCYQDVADVVVDVDELSAEEVVERALAALAALAGLG
jgi:shikimate kinase